MLLLFILVDDSWDAAVISMVLVCLSRCRFTQQLIGAGGGTYIGLPPILNFGQPAVRDKIVGEVFAGKKLVCLAITEAFAGSDVGEYLVCGGKRRLFILFQLA